MTGSVGLILSMFLLQTPAYSETLGTDLLTIDLPNGDVSSTYQMSMKIYQDFNTTPYKQLATVTDNPFAITGLPLNHSYKIEVYMNGIKVGTGYINFQNNNQQDSMNISYNSGMLIYVYYKDGVTPIPNALVSIQGNNQTWATSTTDTNGKAKRFYLSPTINDGDYYSVKIDLGPTLSYVFSPLQLISRDTSFKITTPWPSVLDQLITVRLYENQSSLITTNSGVYVVRVIDPNKNIIAESSVNSRGEAYFSSLKVGYYLIQAVKLSDNSVWGSSDFNLDGSKLNFIILKNHAPASTPTPTPAPVPVTPTPPVTKPNATVPNTPTVPVVTPVTTPAASSTIPLWIKNNAGWWSQGQIENSHFFQGIQYLIQSGEIKIPPTQPVSSFSHSLPLWFKNNANWWSTDLITDNDFVSGIQYLIDKKIIT